MGLRARLPPEHRRPLPRPRRGPPPRAQRAGRRCGRRAPERRPVGVPPRRGAHPLPRQRRHGGCRSRPRPSGGATVVVTYFSGIVDESRPHPARRLPGRLPRPPGRADDRVPAAARGRVAWRSRGSAARTVGADTWTEDLELAGAEAVASYADGPAAGLPAVTRRTSAPAAAWYVATRLDADRHRPARRTARRRDGRRTAARRLAAGRGHPPAWATSASWLFVINHGDVEAEVPVARRRPGRRSRGRGRPAGPAPGASPWSASTSDAAARDA